MVTHKKDLKDNNKTRKQTVRKKWRQQCWIIFPVSLTSNQHGNIKFIRVFPGLIGKAPPENGWHQFWKWSLDLGKQEKVNWVSRRRNETISHLFLLPDCRHNVTGCLMSLTVCLPCMKSTLPSLRRFLKHLVVAVRKATIQKGDLNLALKDGQSLFTQRHKIKGEAHSR